MNTATEPSPAMDANRIRDFIQGEILEDDGISIGLEQDLLLSEVLDSVSVLRVVVFLEAELGIEIPPEDITLENFQTLRQMVEYLSTRGIEPS